MGSTLKDSGEINNTSVLFTLTQLDNQQTVNCEWRIVLNTKSCYIVTRDECNCKFHARAYSVRSPVE